MITEIGAAAQSGSSWIILLIIVSLCIYAGFFIFNDDLRQLYIKMRMKKMGADEGRRDDGRQGDESRFKLKFDLSEEKSVEIQFSPKICMEMVEIMEGLPEPEKSTSFMFVGDGCEMVISMDKRRSKEARDGMKKDGF